MNIGIPKETAAYEHRVGLVPANIKSLVRLGHKIRVQSNAGTDIGISDIEYKKAGAEITDTIEELYQKSNMIIKVTDPSLEECEYLQPNQILFSFLHLAVNEKLAQILLKKGITSIAYETIEDKSGFLPVLAPMSEIAGRMAVQVGAYYLQSNQGGRGTLLGGVPGVKKGVVTVIGSGIVGQNAISMALGMGAQVISLDTDMQKLRSLEQHYRGQVQTLYSNTLNLEDALFQSHIVIGAVLIPGERTPILIKKEYLKSMKFGSVIVDVSINQGGITETMYPTTFENPAYKIDGIIHYGIPNMPSAVARTSTFALTNITTPYLKSIASLGIEGAINTHPELLRGINTHNHMLTHEKIAKTLNYKYYPLNLDLKISC